MLARIMLLSLFVRNFALVEEITILFSNGLNIITGETGAGKSILVDALMMVFGERASADMVRSGAEKSIVEGIFDIAHNADAMRLLAERGFENDGGSLILRRELSAKGTSRCFVNDSPSPLAFVRELGNLLVDFHGQHDHQSLLHSEHHITLLDNSGVPALLRTEYQKIYFHLQELSRSLIELRSNEQNMRKERSFKEFQYAELELLNPVEGEQEQLASELNLIENAEKIHEISSEIYFLMYGDDASVRDRLTKTLNLLEQLRLYNSDVDDYIAECKQSIATAEETAKFIKDSENSLDFRPERIEFLRERLQQYSRMKKKYGENLPDLFKTLSMELEFSENFEAEINRLRIEIAKSRKALNAAGAELTNKRKQQAETLKNGVEKILHDLGIPSANFVVRIEQTFKEDIAEHELAAERNGKYLSAYSNGLDHVEFYVSMNKGEELKSLARVASGGEISRVMLALKTIAADNDRLPMLVFDEIDVGISGRIARKVGFAMRSLSEFHQVVAITHLPQIASLADNHISVEKSEHSGRAIVSAKTLHGEQRAVEVAKLIGGEEVTESVLRSARELIQTADNQEK